MAKTFRMNKLVNNVPPVFEKKGINYSGYIYNYLPVDMPVYTAEVTHRDPVSGELLQKALDRTLAWFEEQAGANHQLSPL